MFYFIALTWVEIESLLRARYTVNSYMYTLYKTNNVKICKFNFYSIPLKKFAKAKIIMKIFCRSILRHNSYKM